MSWVFLTNNSGEREAMDIGITTKELFSLTQAYIDAYVNLIDSIDQPQGVHKAKTLLFSISLPKLSELQSLAQEFTNYDYESAEYRVTATSIQTFDFSTLYTSIPHDLLKSGMNNIINNAFKQKNGATRYTYIKDSRNKSYFTNDPLNGDNKYTASDICKMIGFLVDYLYIYIYISE